MIQIKFAEGYQHPHLPACPTSSNGLAMYQFQGGLNWSMTVTDTWNVAQRKAKQAFSNHFRTNYGQLFLVSASKAKVFLG